MSLLASFITLFETNAREAEADMASAEAQANALGDAMAEVGSVDTTPLNTAAALNEQILATAVEIADAERNIKNYLLGNEEITERTLHLIGGQEGLQKRVAAETTRLAQALIKAEDEASDLTHELKDAEATSRELSTSFVGMVKSIAGPLAALVSVGAMIGGVKSHVDSVTQLIERASRARIDVASYDQWRRAITAAGGSAEQAESQFDAFGERMMEAFGDAESEGGKALKELGLSAKDASGNIKPTEEALLELSGAMAGVSREVAVNNLRRLGIVDPAMVDLILQGRDALQSSLDVQKKNGALTVEQAERFKQLRTTLAGTSDAWAGFMNLLVSGIIPTVTRVLDTLAQGIQWMTKNKTVVQGFGIAMAVALGIAATAALAVYAPAMYAAAAATIAATWPILAIIAAVLAVGAAFALVYEDVKAFLDGQPSLLGELVNKYGWVRDAVEWIGKAFKVMQVGSEIAWGAIRKGAEVVAPILLRILQSVGGGLVRAFGVLASVIRGVWSVAGPILSVLGEAIYTLGVIGFNMARGLIRDITATFRAIEPVARPVLEVVGALFRGLGAVISGVASAVTDAWAAFFGWFVSKVEAAANLAKGLMAFARNATTQVEDGRGGGPRRPGAPGGAMAIRNAQSHLRAADRAPTNAVTSSTVAASRPANRSTTVQIDKVEVQTQATDAKGMASAAGGALQTQIRQAVQDTDDGVSH